MPDEQRPKLKIDEEIVEQLYLAAKAALTEAENDPNSYLSTPVLRLLYEAIDAIEIES